MGIGSGSRDTVNVARLHEFMDRERLAAVVARSGQNFTYLSGPRIRGRSRGTWTSPTRHGR
jgi:Xaa-Pro aminopeptidase